MKQNFTPSMSIIIPDYEGGYSNDPHDPGGPTKYGVTIHDVRMYLIPNATAEDVKGLTLSQAISIYRSKYADRISFDSLWWGVDFATLDPAINSGVGKGKLWLMKACGIAGGVQWAQVVARQSELVVAGKAGDICRGICDIRLGFLHALGNWRYFGGGWGRRVADVRARSVAMAAAHPVVGQIPEHPHVVVKKDAEHQEQQAKKARGHATKSAAGGGAASGGAAAHHTLVQDVNTLIIIGIVAAVLIGVAIYFLWRSNRHATVAQVAHQVAKEITP